jgi:hypothetical protein
MAQILQARGLPVPKMTRQMLLRLRPSPRQSKFGWAIEGDDEFDVESIHLKHTEKLDRLAGAYAGSATQVSTTSANEDRTDMSSKELMPPPQRPLPSLCSANLNLTSGGRGYQAPRQLQPTLFASHERASSQPRPRSTSGSQHHNEAYQIQPFAVRQSSVPATELSTRGSLVHFQTSTQRLQDPYRTPQSNREGSLTNTPSQLDDSSSSRPPNYA